MTPKTRRPHVLGAKLILALIRRECDPVCTSLAEHVGVRKPTMSKLLTELTEAELLARKREQRDGIPPVWTYEVRS